MRAPTEPRRLVDLVDQAPFGVGAVTWRSVQDLPKTGMVDNPPRSYRVHMFTPRWLANALMAVTAALFAMSVAHGKAFFIFYATAALFLAGQVLAQSRRAGR